MKEWANKKWAKYPDTPLRTLFHKIVLNQEDLHEEFHRIVSPEQNVHLSQLSLVSETPLGLERFAEPKKK